MFFLYSGQKFMPILKFKCQNTKFYAEIGNLMLFDFLCRLGGL